MLACLYEDRPQQIAGLKLAVLTLDRYCPTWRILVRAPGMGSPLKRWLGRFRNVIFSETPLAVSGSYNVKPAVLLDGLSLERECLWLDTDVIVNGDIGFLEHSDQGLLIVTQDPWEYASGSTHRCSTWGLLPGRDVPGPLNTAVIRVSIQHQSLLSDWHAMLRREDYLREQRKATTDRNSHMLGDQDALSAIVASATYRDVSIRRLRHTAEILQHHGAGAYGPAQRWTNLRSGLPPILHAMGAVKPWRAVSHPKPFTNFREYYERAYLELSPYVHVARHYGSLLEEDTDWMELHTIAGRIGTLLAVDHPCLKGIMQATLHRVSHYLRALLN